MIACIPGDVTQLHPKPVAGQDEGVSSLLLKKGIILWSLHGDSSKEENCSMSLLAKMLSDYKRKWLLYESQCLFWSIFPQRWWLVVQLELNIVFSF